MTPLINLLTLEKKLLDYIKFIEPIIFEDDHLSNEELKFYTKKSITMLAISFINAEKKLENTLQKYIVKHISY